MKKGEDELKLKDFEKKQKIKIIIWLILPVVICLFQRLSHANVSISYSGKRIDETVNGSLNQQ